MSIRELIEQSILVGLFLNKGRLSPERIYVLIFFISNDIKKLHNKIKFKANADGIYSTYVNMILKKLFKKRYIKKYRSKIGLTNIGRKKVDEIILEFPYLYIIQIFIRFIKKLHDDELLALLYYTFPKYFENVPKLERIEKNRLELAVRLYLKRKVPVEVAAMISGYNITDFIEALKAKNII
jgi:predicted HTH domain antitoxin